MARLPPSFPRHRPTPVTLRFMKGRREAIARCDAMRCDAMRRPLLRPDRRCAGVGWLHSVQRTAQAGWMPRPKKEKSTLAAAVDTASLACKTGGGGRGRNSQGILCGWRPPTLLVFIGGGSHNLPRRRRTCLLWSTRRTHRRILTVK